MYPNYVLIIYSFNCMLARVNALEKENACIIRENIDPKHLGLHVHLGSVIVLKTQQLYQSLGLFSIIFDAWLFSKLKKSSFLHSD